ncbi:MAG TPA: RluA family pseudouridine synthase [Anaerolineae bacterium]|nr:RluA family pseudouridine synthase [Anaerolineae bacterium]
MTLPAPGRGDVADRIITLQAETRERLDKFVAARRPDLSRSAVQRLIGDGLITVNGARSDAARKVGQGDVIVVRIPPPAPATVEAETIPLSIVYEDADLIVVDKPAGLVVHPAAGHARGTLVNAILAHAPDLAGVGGEMRPGIVHRLDKDTSGLIVVAKNDAAHRELQRQFKARSVKKMYLALLAGRLEPGEGLIDAPIARNRIHRQRMAVAIDGRPSRTRYKVIARLAEGVEAHLPPERHLHLRRTAGAVQVSGAGSAGAPTGLPRPAKTSRPTEYTLVEAYPETGRTHQIRVHFAWLGHPLVGDTVYGRKKPALPIERHFLHAARLTLRLPSTGEERAFESPLPEDLQRVLDVLDRIDPIGL